mmetsp:Transcript_15131/g.36336  ORF Transcript_15131/g.36336 Transcript_15131/m.36336 type:complete len:280 (+) Transcript_15131:545-1384(+)
MLAPARSARRRRRIPGGMPCKAIVTSPSCPRPSGFRPDSGRDTSALCPTPQPLTCRSSSTPVSRRSWSSRRGCTSSVTSSARQKRAALAPRMGGLARRAASRARRRQCTAGPHRCTVEPPPCTAGLRPCTIVTGGPPPRTPPACQTTSGGPEDPLITTARVVAVATTTPRSQAGGARWAMTSRRRGAATRSGTRAPTQQHLDGEPPATRTAPHGPRAGVVQRLTPLSSSRIPTTTTMPLARLTSTPWTRASTETGAWRLRYGSWSACASGSKILVRRRP